MSRNPKRGAHADPNTRTVLWPRPSSTPRRAWEHSALEPVSARPPLTEYLHQLWDRRHFIQMHARSQALGQHQGTLLGRVWFILGPLLDGLVYWLIFGVAFNLQQTIPDFVPRLLVGILLFRYFSRSMTSMASSLSAGRGLIRAFSFPRASLPIAAALREVISSTPMLGVLALLLIIIPPGATPTSTWLLMPFALLIITGFTIGAGLIVARIVGLIPDVSNLISYAMRFAMYGSGVIFSVSRFGDHAALTLALTNNPLYIFIEMSRSLLLYDEIPNPSRWLLLTVWATLFLVLGIVFFWGGEAKYGKQRVA